MESAYTIDRVMDIMKSIPLALERQLYIFFASEIDGTQFDHCISDLVNAKLIRHVRDYGYDLKIDGHKGRKKEQQATEDDIAAFWPIAHIGANNIKYVYQGEGPIRLWYIDNDDNMYDITVARSEESLKLAYFIRKRLSAPYVYTSADLADDDNIYNEAELEKNRDKVMEEIVDDAIHAAVFYNIETAKECKQTLLKCKYDVAYVVDIRSGDIQMFDIGDL